MGGGKYAEHTAAALERMLKRKYTGKDVKKS